MYIKNRQVMMAEHISVDTNRLMDVLAEMHEKQLPSVLTTDIIENYMGGFHQNKKVPPSVSWNAQFGKYLKANAQSLGITEIAAKEKVKLNGTMTSASRWAFVEQCD
ncbi:MULTISPECIES: hypothetical protein [Photobacterium]|nr:hypothetical protein [Photobacterium galatheae]MCM0147060.1 hypothetical protein [Photobacterium galatheae]